MRFITPRQLAAALLVAATLVPTAMAASASLAAPAANVATTIASDAAAEPLADAPAGDVVGTGTLDMSVCASCVLTIMAAGSGLLSAEATRFAFSREYLSFCDAMCNLEPM